MKRAPKALLFLILLSTPLQGAETDTVMRDVYDAISYLLPLSIRDAGRQTPWDKELVDAKLDTLLAASAVLQEHAGNGDAEFRLLARSFDQLVNSTAASFRQEWPDFAYYSLSEITDHCVACHARLPSDSQAFFAQRLLARMDNDKLPAEAKALLLVATRQFSEALTVLETLLLDPTMDPIEADYRGLTMLYLRIGLSTSEKLTRVQRLVERYLSRSDLPYYLEQRISHWASALRRVQSILDSQPGLEQALTLYDEGGSASPIAGNRQGAVEDLAAARLIRQHLAANPTADKNLAASLYLKLAVLSLRTSDPGPAVPEMESLLVAAIESAPDSDTARKAYALLEEYGFVHEEHLARQLESRVLIDMKQLKRAAGISVNAAH